MLRTARSHTPEGCLTLRFDPARFPAKPAACYRASWQLPGPDSHRQATTSLSLKSRSIYSSPSNSLGALPWLVELRRTAVLPPRPLPLAAFAVIRQRSRRNRHEDRIGRAAATVQEAVLPARVQEALGELVGAAKEGLLALSVGVGLGVLAELI